MIRLRCAGLSTVHRRIRNTRIYSHSALRYRRRRGLSVTHSIERKYRKLVDTVRENRKVRDRTHRVVNLAVTAPCLTGLIQTVPQLHMVNVAGIRTRLGCVVHIKRMIRLRCAGLSTVHRRIRNRSNLRAVNNLRPQRLLLLVPSLDSVPVGYRILQSFKRPGCPVNPAAHLPTVPIRRVIAGSPLREILSILSQPLYLTPLKGE